MTVFGTRDTGGSGIYWTTVQDDRGVIYLGCDQVLTFDGEHWNRYPVPGGYVIRGLSLGRDRRLWVGAFNEIGYFDQTSSGLSAYHSLMPALPEQERNMGDVWAVFARGDGAVFVATNSVLVWDGKAFVRHALPSARRLSGFRVGDDIYIYHSDSGLLKLTTSGFTTVIPRTLLGKAGVIWAEHDSQGWLLATNSGFLRYADGRIEPFAPEASAFITKNILTAACRLPGGDIAFGTLYGGMAIVGRDGALRRVISTTEGLPSRNVLSLYAANDGALWVTSTSSTTRVMPNDTVSLFDARNGLAGKPCMSIAELDRRVFVATDEGVFARAIDAPGSTGFDLITGLTGRYPDLYADPGSGLYASGFKGVYRLQDHEVSQVFTSSLDVFGVRRSTTQPDTFLATNSYEIVRFDPEGRRGPAILAHLPDLPTTLAEDPAGDIWTGTPTRGAFLVRGEATGGPTSVPVPGPNGKAYRGPALVARLGDGVAVFADGEVNLHTHDATRVLPGFVHAEISCISNADPQSRIWLAVESPFADGIKARTLGRLSLETPARLKWEPFAVEGLDLIGEVRSLHVTSDGALWVGGAEKLLRVDPAELMPLSAPAAPLLLSSVVDGSALPAARNTLTFDFAATNYTRRTALRYQTRLSGGDWSAPLNIGHLTLAGLSDGRYTFSVRIVDGAGFTGPETTWAFTILPPWYRTGYALACWIALAAVVIYGGIQWRLYFLRQHNLRLEALVQKKTSQLEKANAAKSEFIANMSHEIRNPISGILGLSLALEETSLNSGQRGITDSIRSCAALLATLVDDVLDFAKIEAGKVELRPAPFSIRSILEECLAMVQEDARSLRSAIEIRIDPALPTRVVGDSARIQQIILNYLTNALKFGGGQPVTIGAERGRHDRIHFYVRDTGVGMSAEEAASLFTKFTRLERARAGNIRGTGLGLAVCRHLADKMNGTVGVESTPGQGSCFWVDLPLPPASADDAPPALSTDAAGLHALIVEDIDYNAVAMQAVLRKLGIASDIASDGPSALEQLSRNSYDVAFMDWNLPGLIGTEVVSRYRATEPPGHRTIIIATTAYSAEFNREACLQAGMDAFIAKPFTPEKIAAALRDLRGSLRGGPSVAMGQSTSPEDIVTGLDLQMLRFLADETPGGLAVQISRYLEAFESDRALLAPAIARATPHEIHRIAHRLASHASLINAAELKRLSVELQARAEGDRAVLAGLATDFDRAYEDLTCRLAAFRASMGSA